MVRGLVRGIDSLLRRCLRVYEFSREEDCVVRLSLGRATRRVELSDGTQILPGDPVGLMHFWNEHLPAIGAQGPDLAWALAFGRRLTFSLRLLAAHIEETPAFDGAQAFGGGLTFGSRYEAPHLADLLGRWGFDLFAPDGSESLPRRFGQFWENLFAVSLIWAYNPGSLAGGSPWHLRRDQIWMPRSVLLAKYGGGGSTYPSLLLRAGGRSDEERDRGRAGDRESVESGRSRTVWGSEGEAGTERG